MIKLICVPRTDPRYQSIRDRHYVPNRGCHGQQLHYLVEDDGEVAGIISGASAVYGCAARDKFFGLSKTREVKQAQINSIVNNVVFRLESTRKNLATQVLAMWRKRIAADWEFLYGVPVCGFETFVVEEDLDDGRRRLGTLYLADNWTHLGMTKGNTKVHAKDAGGGGMNVAHTRASTTPKALLCIKTKGCVMPVMYESTWRDKEKSKQIAKRRKTLIGDKSPGN